MRSKANNGWQDPQDHDDDQAAFYPSFAELVHLRSRHAPHDVATGTLAHQIADRSRSERPASA